MKRINIKAAARFTPPAPLDGLFLPDLCNIRILLLVIVIAEMLAFVLTLAGSTPGQGWQDLGLISLFVQWVALLSVLALCLSRPWLASFNNTQAGYLSFFIINAMTLAITEISFQYIVTPNMDRSAMAHIDLLLRNLGISVIVSLLTLRYFYLQYQSSKSILAENTARIEALQARIRPHFLFNSMNIIASLTRTDPLLAEKAVESLSQVFRASLADIKKKISLHEEVAICRSYLQIEKLRLGDRLNIEWDIGPEVEHDSVPPLLLQPLIENAVVHGIEPLTEGGTIVISARHLDNKMLELKVTNPCEDNIDACDAAKKGNQIALNNISQRLDTLYKGKSCLSVGREDNYFIAIITIPVAMSGNAK